MTEAAKLITMARYLARKRVKEHLQACGIKLEASEINRAADAYLEFRRAELIAEAKAILSR
jgi:hypothetical protein